MRISLALLLGLLLLTSEASAATVRQRPAPPRSIDELRARIAQVLERQRVAGVGVALVTRDRVLWAGGVGLADRAEGLIGIRLWRY